MANFTFNISDATNFSVNRISLVETDCASQYEYQVISTEGDSITIELTGEFINGYFLSNGSRIDLASGNPVTFGFSTDLYIYFGISNSGQPGIFDSVRIDVLNNTTSNSYINNEQRNNDSLPCDDPNNEGRTYDSLTDTPGTKIGNELKLVRVNAVGTAHEYVNAEDVISGGSATLTQEVSQVSHNLQVAEAIYFNGTSYLKAQADSLSTSGVIGLVKEVIDSDNFVFQFGGIMPEGSWILGTDYFLDNSTAGGVVLEPTYLLGETRVFIGQATAEGLLINIDIGQEITSQTGSDDYIKSVTTGEPVGSDSISNVVSLTQAEYDTGVAFSLINPTTTYLITDA